MFVNFSNHPSAHWDEKQIRMARCYGDIVDIPFPDIPPEEDEAYITSLTERYVRLIVEQYSPQKDVVHIMGEMCFSFSLIILVFFLGLLEDVWKASFTVCYLSIGGF